MFARCVGKTAFANNVVENFQGAYMDSLNGGVFIRFFNRYISCINDVDRSVSTIGNRVKKLQW